MTDNIENNGTTLPGRLPLKSQGEGSFLVEETTTMAREQRLKVQQQLKELAAVHQRERYENQSPGVEEEQINVPAHPDLQSQRVDGVDRNESPNPTDNTDAARELDNELRKQEQEYQLRMGLTPTKSTAPKPSMGR